LGIKGVKSKAKYQKSVGTSHLVEEINFKHIFSHRVEYG